MDARLEQLDFAELPGWNDDEPVRVIAAMARCHRHLASAKPYRTGSLGLTVEDILDDHTAAAQFSGDGAAARAFFETRFTPFRIIPDRGRSGLVTAFYEPEVEVRHAPDADFRFPFYRRPDDLVDIDPRNPPPGIKLGFAFGQSLNGEVSTYPDRRAIDENYLDGRGLEIAWARSQVDVFFAHVQGAARLVFPDGGVMRITYAAKTGHPFSPIGRLLIDRGEIPAAEISMGSIRAWLAAHPQSVEEVLWHNRSYIFFREAPVEEPDAGPIAAAKVQLEPGRSLAVDRLIHTFGFPFFIVSDSLTHMDAGRPFRRLMLALDTGTAIVGPARGDIFTGSGDAAGDLAGNVRNDADFIVLIPNRAAGRYRHG